MRLILHSESSHAADGMREKRCTLERLDRTGTSSRDRLYFRFPEQIEATADHDMENFTLAAVMLAMREGRTLEIRGEVTDTLLANLTEYMHAWHCWLPRDYFSVEIEAERIRNEYLPGERNEAAICAYSGGMDASAMVWTHVRKKRGWQSRKLALAVIVHGMDIPLEDKEMFDRYHQWANQTLSSIGLPLIPLATNLRRVIDVQWLHLFGAALAASLMNFKPYGSYGLIASNEPYNALMFPLGSSPLTDHLFSSRDLNIIHDGSAFSRVDKARQISDWPAGLETLRVCWEGQEKWKNCGVCEKCMRTKFNFLAAGHDPPSSLGSKPCLWDLIGLRIRSRVLINEWHQIRRVARENGIQSPLFSAMGCVLFRERIRTIFRDLERRIRRRRK
jgi:hypothetical protein